MGSTSASAFSDNLCRVTIVPDLLYLLVILICIPNLVSKSSPNKLQSQFGTYQNLCILNLSPTSISSGWRRCSLSSFPVTPWITEDAVLLFTGLCPDQGLPRDWLVSADSFTNSAPFLCIPALIPSWLRAGRFLSCYRICSSASTQGSPEPFPTLPSFPQGLTGPCTPPQGGWSEPSL